MNNSILRLKIIQRLNKLSSNDYDNIECWKVVEAFNKGQSDWCRRNLHGINILKEGDEESTSRIDDFQVLLSLNQSIKLTDRGTYYESEDLPENYLRWKRLAVNGKSECCVKNRPMIVYLAQQENVDLLLRDINKKPSYEWGETFATISNNKIQVYTNGEFALDNAKLTFYRQPRKIQIKDCIDPYTSILSTVDIESEFKDDITELLIDEAVGILAGDIESFNQSNIAFKRVENNN